MQLFTPLGFRYVNCKNCATQSWSRGWLCECGVALHNCEIHRVDPSNHTSTKPQKKSEEKSKEESQYKDSKRRAPDSVQSTTKKPLKRARVKITTHSYGGGDAAQDQDQAASNTLGGRFLEKCGESGLRGRPSHALWTVLVALFLFRRRPSHALWAVLAA